MPPQMGDLRLVDEVEDVAARWIEELRVADRPLPCGRVAFGVTRFVLVMGVTQERKVSAAKPGTSDERCGVIRRERSSSCRRSLLR